MTVYQTQPKNFETAFRLAAGLITEKDARRLDTLIRELSPYAGTPGFNTWVLFAWESGEYTITRNTWESDGLHGKTFDDILAAVRRYYEELGI